MAAEHSLTRRSALAGIGAGSLALFLGASAAADPPMAESGGSGSGTVLSTSDHPLAGTWLSMVGLLDEPDTIVAVPTFFGIDGTAVLCFPGTDIGEHGIRIKSPAMGAWRPIDGHTAQVTAVQVLSNLAGGFAGSVTFDTYATVSNDLAAYNVDPAQDQMTIRDGHNQVLQAAVTLARNHLHGFRLQPGSPGFPDLSAEQADDDAPRWNDPRTPD